MMNAGGAVAGFLLTSLSDGVASRPLLQVAF